MAANLKNCLVCLNYNNLYKFGVFGKRKVVDEASHQDKDDESRCVDNQVQVIFLLTKMLEIPKIFCIKFFQEYGNPSSWIYCCNKCSILVDEARTVFDEITLLQKKFENFQVRMKNEIKNSVKSQANAVNTAPKNWPNEIVRAYVAKEDNVKTEIMEPLIKKEEIQGGTISIESDFQGWSPVATSSNSEIDEEQPAGSTEINANEQDNNCNYFCKDVEDFIEDIEEIEDCDGKNHTCRICGEDFNGIENFIRHKLIHIRKNRLFECDICKRRFTQNRILEMHYVIHSGEQYLCKFCDENFENFAILKLHVITHTGQMPYTCRQCPNNFKNLSRYKSHLKWHDERRASYPALYLETVASTSSNLLQPTLPQAENKCDICKSEFVDLEKLSEHIKSHSTECRH